MSSPSGGLARRVGLDRALAPSAPQLPRLWLDAGNAVAGLADEVGRAQAAAIYSVMGELGVRAANVAENEVRAGLDDVVGLAERHGVPLLSASLVHADADGGQPFPSHLVLPVGRRRLLGLRLGARRVVVVGLMRHLPELRGEIGGRPVRTRPPREALRGAMDEVAAERPHVVVVLAALSVPEIEDLVREHPGIDLVLGGLGDAPSERVLGQTLLLHPGSRGQRVVEVRLGDDEGRAQAPFRRMHVLDPRHPVDAAGLALEAATRRRVNDIWRQRAEEQALRPPVHQRPTHAGATACRACHVAEYLAWESTAHAGALATLARESADFDPTCLPCHVTGLGRPGGFRSSVETPELGGVQCEACHGPGLEHASSGGRAELTPRSGSAACVGCHDEANSPDFDFEVFWERVRHGTREPERGSPRPE